MSKTTQAANTSAAPASGSPTPGKAMPAQAAATAVAPAKAAVATSPGAATPAPEIPLSKGLEQLNDDQVLASFMGSGPMPGAKEQKEGVTEETTEETATEEETTEEQTAEETVETETETEAEEETTEEGEEVSDLEKGLLKALSDDPKLKGLHKRIKGIFGQAKTLKAENAELKSKLETGETAPVVLTPPNSSNPLNAARTDEEVEAVSTELLADARKRLRKLNRIQDGGTFIEDDGKEITLTSDQVEGYLEYYENLTTTMESHKAARKSYLAKYAETKKATAAEAVEILNPKGTSREAMHLRKVPELTRDPEFLQILADAKAGRELREKKARGISMVEIDPKKKADPNGKAKVTQTPAAVQQPSNNSNGRGNGQPLTAATLADLRTKAENGDKEAQHKLEEFFMAS